MTLSEENAKLLGTIRRAVGEDEFSAGDLTARCAGLRAKENKELAAALRGRSAKSVGNWLKRHQGAIHEGYRLCAHLGRRPKVWLYNFEPMTQLGPETAAALDALECEMRIGEARPGSIRYVAECERQLDRAIAANPEAFAAPSEEPKPLTHTFGPDSEGRFRTELVIDPRSGEPIKEKPPSAAPVVEAPEPPARSTPADPRPPWQQRGESVPRDRVEWLAHQEFRRTGKRPGEQPGVWHEGLWYDPGGIVSHGRHDSRPREQSTLWNGSLRDL